MTELEGGGRAKSRRGARMLAVSLTSRNLGVGLQKRACPGAFPARAWAQMQRRIVSRVGVETSAPDGALLSPAEVGSAA